MEISRYHFYEGENGVITALHTPPITENLPLTHFSSGLCSTRPSSRPSLGDSWKSSPSLGFGLGRESRYFNTESHFITTIKGINHIQILRRTLHQMKLRDRVYGILLNRVRDQDKSWTEGLTLSSPRRRLGGNYAKPRQYFAVVILEYGKQCYAIPVSVCACLHQPDQVLFAPV